VVNAVARGIGRQRFVAFLTSGCLLLIGVPIGLTMCFKMNRGVEWLMLGPTVGIFVSLCVYSVFFYRLNWATVLPSYDVASGDIDGASGEDAEIITVGKHV